MFDVSTNGAVWSKTRHSHNCSGSQVCLRFFDAGQCVRFVSGGLARVDKSDKVEAAGCVRCVMGKAQASISDIGLSFVCFAEFGGPVWVPVAKD